jgi:hypothetical protein
MLSQLDIDALAAATQNKLQVTLTYTKKATGETVVHTGGVYEIGVNKSGAPCVWLWDTSLNDNIRQFLTENIISLQVLDIPFSPPQPYPIKINGQIVG